LGRLLAAFLARAGDGEIQTGISRRDRFILILPSQAENNPALVLLIPVLTISSLLRHHLHYNEDATVPQHRADLAKEK
jgi:hypothetical protein